MFELYNTSDSKKLTYSDYAAKDDGFRYELINGELIMVPAPSACHQTTNKKLLIKLDEFIESNSLGELFIPPMDVVLDDNNTVQPDILIVLNENVSKIEENAIYGAPDFVVEIISPGSVIKDRHIKKEFYEKSGVKEYWIVDINNQTVEVFQNIDFKFELFSYAFEKGKILSYLFPEFDISIENIMPDFKLKQK